MPVPSIRSILGLEAILFAAASLVHAGILYQGYEHSRAATAEGVIAAVLILGLLACIVAPRRTRLIALAVQGFALLGTLVGAFTIAVGIGPQTTADKTFHIILLVVLVVGLVVIFRSPRSEQGAS
ncbi:peptidoglycan/LPS O-acetylase OafA/YrhL [Sinorhizobium terangae]|uniref:Uncharacterized protein n=1 Tax=Sinorhizobium terangae TaxID=110322 RepID=A0A6N7LHY4_SINTE|nr:hypothetical protein [Sinorhizobium terangae]MBB4184671.1 peptidoglycan/LPS O-acetylase OafA/YrhL [Sinorhizobium terangae]MQX16818.1 hypothetical protein [Sinorhizobium terangae]